MANDVAAQYFAQIEIGKGEFPARRVATNAIMMANMIRLATPAAKAQCCLLNE